MITVKLNRRDFEYDIHSLVKAFYPVQDVTVSDEECAEPADMRIFVDYADREIAAMIRCEEKNELLCDDSDCEISGRIEVNDASDRKEMKNALKSLLYRMLSKASGRKLPWGNLTGIRPVKIPMDLLEKGMPEAEVIRVLKEQYFVSDARAYLALSTAKTEKRILSSLDYKNGYSLYIGIPFCPSICLYCSFSSSPIGVWKKRVDDYLKALFYEMKESAHLFDGYELQSVYIGGGTPTTLEPYQMDALLCELEKHYDLSHVREFTVEAGRPDTITREKLQVLRDHGISRISINPQTMNQETLDVIGRKHTVEQIREAYAMAREMGFDDINMDTIVGLTGEGMEQVSHTMTELIAMKPDNLTVHSLALKRAARLSQEKDRFLSSSFTNSEQIMDMTMQKCEEAGLYPYYLYRQKNMAGNFENVGYAAEGKEGLYNILIMEEVQSILALGAGASTKMVEPDGLIERIENVKDIANYIDRIEEMVERKRRIPEVMARKECDA